MSNSKTHPRAIPRKIFYIVLVSFWICGCEEKHQNLVPTTGALAVARDYFESIVRQDWKACYVLLHPDSQKKMSQEQYSRFAQEYRRKMAFTPEKVHIHACTERENDAIAHVTLSGKKDGKNHTFKEGAVLKRSGQNWRIKLPATR